MLNHTVAAVELAQGIGFGLLAGVAYRRQKAKLARCYKTRGEVVEVRERAGGEAATCHPVIRYTTPSGEQVTFESRYGRSDWPVKAGDSLDILVNRNDPADAEVDTFVAQWGSTLVFAVISVTGFIAAPIVFLLLQAR